MKKMVIDFDIFHLHYRPPILYDINWIITIEHVSFKTFYQFNNITEDNVLKF